MAYEKQNWEYGASGNTPLNPQRLGHIEDGVYNNQNMEILDATDTTPTTFSDGDKYFNTTNNKIYVANDDTWEVLENAVRGIIYIVPSKQKTFYFTGTELISVGGGGGGTSDNVVNEYSESDTDTYSCDYENNTFVDKSSIRDSYSTGNDEAFYNCDYANEHFGGTVLYNNDSGTSGDITLSESVVNYKCIEIYFKDNNGNSPNSIKFRGSGIICLSTYEYSNNIHLRVSSYVLNGSSLTFSSGKYHEIATGNELVGNYLKIYQVIGYK